MPIETKARALYRVLKREGYWSDSKLLRKVYRRLVKHEEDRTFINIDNLRMAIDVWKLRESKSLDNRDVKQFIRDLRHEIYEEYDFLRQLHVAEALSDSLMKRRGVHIVNDADTREANKGALMQSMADQLKMAFKTDGGEFDPKTFLERNKKTRPSHWKDKGREVSQNRTMKIRCAECAALVAHELRKLPGFNLPLSIIEQGKGSIDGHFWVVAGNITKTTGTPNFGEDTFAIDLWGAATKHIREGCVVGPPATRPFEMNNNGVKKLVTLM